MIAPRFKVETAAPMTAERIGVAKSTYARTEKSNLLDARNDG
jgi:hypothetical protein